MKPDAFILLANRLASDAASGPEAHRSAISRAYYGAYLSVLNFKDDLGISCRIESKLSEHQSLQQLLANSNVPPAIEISQRLANLHESRKEADYEMGNLRSENPSSSADAVRRANVVINLLSQCQQAPTRSQLMVGLMQYRKLLGLSPK